MESAPTPDRVSVNKQSKYYMPPSMAAKLEITFNGIRQMWLQEFCVSEGWVIREKRTALGVAFKKDGQIVTERLNGNIAVKWI